MQKNAWLAALAVAIAFSAFAEELHVPSRYPTLQAAVTASTDGDHVVVAPGTYREAVDMLGRQITLRSSGGAGVTILDGEGIHASLLTLDKGESAGGTIVRGFTFRNGHGNERIACNVAGPKGGAIFVSHAGVSVLDSVFEDNGETDEGRGGAIYACDADLAVLGSRMERNAAAHDGAIYFQDATVRRLTIEHTTFRANEAATGGGVAALLFALSGMTIRASAFEANDAAHGGGVSIFADARSTVAITASRFQGNRSSHGAGVQLVAAGRARATLADLDFAGGVAAFGAGATVHVSGAASAELLRCDFRGHEAGFGGGLFAAAAGNVPAAAGGTIRIDSARFFDNVAHRCCNTGVVVDSCFTDGPAPEGNGQHLGGGAALRTITGGTIVMSNAVFSGNSAPDGAGGGLHASSCAGGTIEVLNSTIVENDSTGVSVRLGKPRNGELPGVGTINVVNSIVRDNDAVHQIDVQRLGNGDASITYSNVEGGFAGTGNMDADPKFVNAAARDFRLSEGSMCIDAGDSVRARERVTTDVAGRPRFVDDLKTRDTGRGESPVVDIGAFEYQPGRRRTVRR